MSGARASFRAHSHPAPRRPCFRGPRAAPRRSLAADRLTSPPALLHTAGRPPPPKPWERARAAGGAATGGTPADSLPKPWERPAGVLGGV